MVIGDHGNFGVVYQMGLINLINHLVSSIYFH